MALSVRVPLPAALRVAAVLPVTLGACDAQNAERQPRLSIPAAEVETVTASLRAAEWQVVPTMERAADPAIWISQIEAVGDSVLAGLDRHDQRLMAWDLRSTGPGRVIADEGAGPGELRCPASFATHADGYVLFDTCDVKLIGLDWNGDEQWRLRIQWDMANPLFSTPTLAKAGDVWLVATHDILDVRRAVDGEIVVEARLARLTRSGAERLVPVTPLVRTQMRWRNLRDAGPPYWMPFIWAPMLRWALHPGRGFVVAHHDSSYHLEVVPLHAGSRRRIVVPGGSRPTTDAERDSLTGAYLSDPVVARHRPEGTFPVSSARAPVAGLRFAPDGVLWVEYVGALTDLALPDGPGIVVDRITVADDTVRAHRGLLPCFPDAFLTAVTFACVENPDVEAPLDDALRAPVIRVYTLRQ